MKTCWIVRCKKRNSDCVYVLKREWHWFFQNNWHRYLIFSVCAACTLVYITADSCRYARYVYEPCCRVYSVYEILIMFEIKYKTKIQDSDTNLYFNIWPLQKYVGLLTFRNIHFLHFRYVQRIVNYSVQTRAVPRVNLIKISHSQVNIFIIFITFLSGKFQCWCRNNDENVGHSNE